MGNVKQIDPIADEVLQTLTERLAAAQSGKIDGFIMLSVYKKIRRDSHGSKRPI